MGVNNWASAPVVKVVDQTTFAPETEAAAAEDTEAAETAAEGATETTTPATQTGDAMLIASIAALSVTAIAIIKKKK